MLIVNSIARPDIEALGDMGSSESDSSFVSSALGKVKEATSKTNYGKRVSRLLVQALKNILNQFQLIVRPI